jgi:hypothetical protein
VEAKSVVYLPHLLGANYSDLSHESLRRNGSNLLGLSLRVKRKPGVVTR